MPKIIGENLIGRGRLQSRSTDEKQAYNPLH
jgi:hypothetical protein